MIKNKTNQFSLIKLLFVSIVITLFLAINTNMFFLSNSGITVMAWDGSTTSAPLSGDGSESTPYLITSPEELAWVASEVNAGNLTGNKYFELTQDIYLEDYEWTPIGNYNSGDITTAFTGNFNGNGHSVYDLDITNNLLLASRYVGLFGYVQGATIENLKLKRTLINLTGDYGVAGDSYEIGGLAGVCKYSTVNDVRTYGDITLRSSSRLVDVAGVFGYAENLNGESVASSVDVSVLTVTGEAYVGGVAGRLINSDIEKCFNRGTIVASSSDVLYVGGLAGAIENSTARKDFNEGDITCTSSLEVYVGGIAGVYGELTNAPTQQYNMEYTYNVGDITVNHTGELNTAMVGGLIGQLKESYALFYSYNASSIDVSFTEGKESNMLGAIVGKLDTLGNALYCYYDKNEPEETNMPLSFDNIGIGVEDGSTSDIIGQTTALMKQKTTYNSGDAWNMDNYWAFSGKINNSYPVLKYVGNFGVNVQILNAGGTYDNMTVTTSTANLIYYYDETTSPTYYIKANSGYQIKYLYLQIDGEPVLTITDYKGESVANYSLSTGYTYQTLGISFENISFTKTALFYWVLGLSITITIMIVGTAIINHNYEVKMDRMMEKKKEAISMKLPNTED
ncbi:MAG: hypothetical protein AB7S44_02150 [Spirochaetales bacterium]